jgi:hypothetical protein
MRPTSLSPTSLTRTKPPRAGEQLAVYRARQSSAEVSIAKQFEPLEGELATAGEVIERHQKRFLIRGHDRTATCMAVRATPIQSVYWAVATIEINIPLGAASSRAIGLCTIAAAGVAAQSRLVPRLEKSK